MAHRDLAIPLRQGRVLRIPRPAGVMAILNITPDSFSDGGWLISTAHAVETAGTFLEAGAAILDVGGESTRPRGGTYGEGASEVPADVEISCVVPFLHAVRAGHPETPLSVDTRKGSVARAALRRGPTW